MGSLHHLVLREVNMESVQKSVIQESLDDPTATESDSNVSDYPESFTPVPRLTSYDRNTQIHEKKMMKNDLLLEARLSESRHRNELHSRAKKLKHHYKEVDACDKIMAYGFIAIIFLLTGFYWFIMIFSQEIKQAFQEYHIIGHVFMYGSILLGGLNFI